MDIPFTKSEFVQVFRSYNEAVFPLQIVFYILAFVAVRYAIKKTRWSSLLVMTILSFFWVWMGLVYHVTYFSVINNAANIFGVAFIIQGILFALLIRSVEFKFQNDLYGTVAFAVIAYGVAIYPLVGYSIGHSYPDAPTFGVPCPTTIFTFGIFLLTDKKCPTILLIIPGIWSLIGLSAALRLEFYEDIGLFASSVTAIVLLTTRRLILKHQFDKTI